MLNCKEVAERASALIDGELGTFEVMSMHLHLAMCKGCGAFIAQMRTTCDLTQGEPTPPNRHDTDDEGVAAILSRFHDNKKTGD